MELSDLKTDEEVLAEDLKDPEFRAEWERTALARAIALIVLRYRYDHGLSQRALGELMDMPQPQVSRLEAGDHNPSIETLTRLARTMDLELTIDIRLTSRIPKLVTRRAQTQNAIASCSGEDYTILLAAA